MLVQGNAWEAGHLPLWVRVWVFGIAHHGMPLQRGQLSALFQVDKSSISRAIQQGKHAGLLAHDSSARTLYVKRAP